jgi:hypothetical protein
MRPWPDLGVAATASSQIDQEGELSIEESSAP